MAYQGFNTNRRYQRQFQQPFQPFQQQPSQPTPPMNYQSYSEPKQIRQSKAPRPQKVQYEGSQARGHDERQREKIGQKLQAADKAANFKYLYGLPEVVELEHLEVQLSVSTAGVPVAIQDYQERTALVQNIDQILPSPLLFRYSMLQVANRIDEKFQKISDDREIPVWYSPLPLEIKREITFTKNFDTIAKIISGLGSFSFDDVNFKAFIPQIQVGNFNTVDPFFVNFLVLRNVNNMLSGLDMTEVAQNVRRMYRDRNVLPGANWNEQGLLVNADQYFPPNYGPANVIADARQVLNAFEKISNKVKGIQFDYVDFGSSGTPAQLVTQYTQEDNVMLCHGVKEYYSAYKLSDFDYNDGVILQSGRSNIPNDTTRITRRLRFHKSRSAMMTKVLYPN